MQTLKRFLHGRLRTPQQGRGCRLAGVPAEELAQWLPIGQAVVPGKELTMGWAPPQGAGGFLQARVWLWGVRLRIQVTQVISVLLPSPSPVIPSFLGNFSMPGSSLGALHT